MTGSAPRQGRCPNCGAPVEFKLGASRATICGHCSAIVVRAGQDFEAVGKVADLIPTGSRVALGSHGSVGGLGYDVMGRLQYEWQQGVWDEWYVAFADGSWGWLAEAQGRYYVTRRMSPRPVPRRVEPGQSFFLEGLGRFTVSDVKQARIVAGRGELPEVVTPGEAPLTADCESEKGGFATIDYGDGSEPPALYVGRELPFEALHLGDLPAGAEVRQPRPSGEKLKCPNCGAPLSLRLPDQSVRVVCESCNHLLDTSQGAFRVLGALERGKKEPRIPLGSKGTLRGRELLVVGWMLRSCVVEGTRYPWAEYLLWDEKTQSFAWLVESEGHWQLGLAVPVSEVVAADDAEYRHRRFRHFSSVKARVDQVLGEFYWAVQVGDEVQSDVYIRPPEGLSRELGGGEVNWTHLDHLDVAEVARGFDRPGLVQERPSTVGELQPWPHEATWRAMRRWMVAGILALLALLVVFGLRPTRVLVDQSFSPEELLATPVDTTPGGDQVRSFLSSEFEVGGGALRVELSSDAVNTWATAEGAVIDTATSVAAPFGLESSFYSGVDEGERWTEDHRTASTGIASPGSGTAVLRADLQWEQGHPPPAVRLRVKGETFSVLQFLGCLLLLSWPLVYPLRRASFERARWENSNLGSDEGGD